MSEMLGNQYFMARNYKEAVRELEPVYLKDSSNKSVRRKLIIGYTQIGKIKKSLELFTSLVKEDVQYIITADPVFDDCPCTELKKGLKDLPIETVSPEVNIFNGILWLFCDPKISIKFLQEAIKDLKDNAEIKESIEIIEKSLYQSS